MSGYDESILALCVAARGLIDIINDRDIALGEADRNALLPALRKISEKIRSQPIRSIHDAAAKLRFVVDNLDELGALDDELAATLGDAFCYLKRHYAAQKAADEELQR
jgi:hypothetical protein